MDLPVGYDARLFVTPQEVGQYVHARIKNWKGLHWPSLTRPHIVGLRSSSTGAPGDLVLSLVGERGVGKTWLLRHLMREHRFSSRAVYLNLESRSAYSSVDEYVNDVEDQVARTCGDDPALLLLDHVPPHLDEHLKALEEMVLRPHLTFRRSLVVMALIHPTQVCWRAPDLRGGASVVMPRFNQMQTRLQWRCLEKAGLAQPVAMPADLWRLSNGLPLLNYLLATRPRVDAFELLLGYWLDRVPAAERSTVRVCLDAVCELESLELAGIQRMLDIYGHYHDEPAGYPVHARGVPNLLRKHWLARPAADAPGRIVLVDSVQRAVREVMRARNASLLAMLQEAA
ncbi:MAG TPA: AAA family ATPase [Anaerolineae bacterium]|nr:AAA family ATPase [Anaerolineae bacterium]